MWSPTPPRSFYAFSSCASFSVEDLFSLVVGNRPCPRRQSRSPLEVAGSGTRPFLLGLCTEQFLRKNGCIKCPPAPSPICPTTSFSQTFPDLLASCALGGWTKPKEESHSIFAFDFLVFGVGQPSQPLLPFSYSGKAFVFFAGWTVRLPSSVGLVSERTGNNKNNTATAALYLSLQWLSGFGGVLVNICGTTASDCRYIHQRPQGGPNL
jgi:hypothetical protein